MSSPANVSCPLAVMLVDPNTGSPYRVGGTDFLTPILMPNANSAVAIIVTNLSAVTSVVR